MSAQLSNNKYRALRLSPDSPDKSNINNKLHGPSAQHSKGVRPFPALADMYAVCRLSIPPTDATGNPHFSHDYEPPTGRSPEWGFNVDQLQTRWSKITWIGEHMSEARKQLDNIVERRKGKENLFSVAVEGADDVWLFRGEMRKDWQFVGMAYIEGPLEWSGSGRSLSPRLALPQRTSAFDEQLHSISS
jgi:hypothetical protein